jgi:hypothetical protein
VVAAALALVALALVALALVALALVALALAGLPVAVVNPRQVRDFAKAPAGWPRRTRWMRWCWRTSPRCCSRSHAPCPMQRVRHWRPWWSGATRWSACAPPRSTACSRPCRRCAPRGLYTLPGWSRRWRRWMPSWTRRCAPAPCGASATTSCAASLELARTIARTLARTFARLPELGQGSAKHLATLVGLAPRSPPTATAAPGGAPARSRALRRPAPGARCIV